MRKFLLLLVSVLLAGNVHVRVDLQSARIRHTKKQKKDNSLSFNGMTMDCKSIHVCTMHCGRIANPPERESYYEIYSIYIFYVGFLPEFNCTDIL